jgi:hypothetical protein
MSKHPSLTEIAAKLGDASRPPASGAEPKGRAKSRMGKKLILVPLDPEIHLKLRHRALDEGRTVEAFVQAAIAAYLAKPASTP